MPIRHPETLTLRLMEAKKSKDQEKNPFTAIIFHYFQINTNKDISMVIISKWNIWLCYAVALWNSFIARNGCIKGKIELKRKLCWEIYFWCYFFIYWLVSGTSWMLQTQFVTVILMVILLELDFKKERFWGVRFFDIFMYFKRSI